MQNQIVFVNNVCFTRRIIYFAVEFNVYSTIFFLFHISFYQIILEKPFISVFKNKVSNIMFTFVRKYTGILIVLE